MSLSLNRDISKYNTREHYVTDTQAISEYNIKTCLSNYISDL